MTFEPEVEDCQVQRREMSGAPSEDEIRSKWPLHWLVWKDDHKALKRLLAETESLDLERLDPRGRTPLHLAVSLSRVSCSAHLLQANANPLAENRHKWSVLNEAVCTGSPELIGLVLRYRDQRLLQVRTREIPLMLERLEKAPDYYMEMKWQFSSWVPFVSRMCPSDTCRIWKKGTTVRVDTTLIGFEKLSWQRGHQTLIFQATPSGHRVMDINHNEKTVWEKEFKIAEQDPLQTMLNLEMGVLHRLTAPVVSTFVSTDNIVFQRQKSGIWGFRSDKTEDVDGYQAKVFGSSGLEIVTQTRVEHLPEGEKRKQHSINPLQDFLGAAQDHGTPAIEAPPQTTPIHVEESKTVKLALEEYFTEPLDRKEYDVLYRPPEVNMRVQKLKATVGIAEHFPLSLQDQIMPIIDLMALSAPHFAKMKDFINMQMPAGFPIKLEIPLFHVISAKVTFMNINGHASPVPHVSLSSTKTRLGPTPVLTPAPSSPTQVGGVKRRHGQAMNWDESSVDTPPGVDEEEGSEVVEVCSIAEECFAVPAGYQQLHGGGRGTVDQEEELLQMAIQQSLLGAPQESGAGELSLHEALQDEGMKNGKLPVFPPVAPPTRRTAEEEEFELVLAMSKAMAQREQEEREREAAEEEQLERVLRLSLQEK